MNDQLIKEQSIIKTDNLQINRNIPTNILLITDSEKVYKHIENRSATILLIQNETLTHDEINTMQFYINHSRSLITIIKQKKLLYNFILPICYVLVKDFEENEILHILSKELVDIEALYKEIKHLIRNKPFIDIFFGQDSKIEHKDVSLLREIDDGLYAVFSRNFSSRNIKDTYDYFVAQWKSFYEPVLNKRYYSDVYFKEYVNKVNYRRYVSGPDYQLIRPIMLYVLWLIDYTEGLDSHKDTKRLMEFAYYVSNYMFIEKNLRDRRL